MAERYMCPERVCVRVRVDIVILLSLRDIQIQKTFLGNMIMSLMRNAPARSENSIFYIQFLQVMSLQFMVVCHKGVVKQISAKIGSTPKGSGMPKRTTVCFLLYPWHMSMDCGTNRFNTPQCDCLIKHQFSSIINFSSVKSLHLQSLPQII